MPKHIEYDPAIIQTFVNGLYAQARRIVVTYVILGFLIGGAAGLIIANLNSIQNQLIPAVVAGLFVALLAHNSAKAKAFSLKLQAQQTLCQVATEKNTRRL